MPELDTALDMVDVLANAERMDSKPARRFDRRRLLTTAAVLGGAVPLALPGTANAAVAPSPKFVLSGAGDDPVVRRTLQQSTWAMQSFAHDHLNGHLYFVQSKPGTDPGHNGDLWITKTNETGDRLGYMELLGFGHGSSMGIEPTTTGAAPYVWIEGGDSNDNGAGERLARFRFTHKLTLDYFNPSIPIDDLTPGSDLTSFAKLPRPAIDPYANRLILRYATHEPATRVWRLAVFDLADARAGRLADANRLVERAIPNNSELGLTDADLFQGITACGQYAYLYYGGPDRPSWLVTIDLNAVGGSYVEKFQTNAGASLPGREAQGIAIWLASGAPRLAFGYSSGGGGQFMASVFYKSEFR
jgi:hypothetical protein